MAEPPRACCPPGSPAALKPPRHLCVQSRLGRWGRSRGLCSKGLEGRRGGLGTATQWEEAGHCREGLGHMRELLGRAFPGPFCHLLTLAGWTRAFPRGTFLHLSGSGRAQRPCPVPTWPRCQARAQCAPQAVRTARRPPWLSAGPARAGATGTRAVDLGEGGRAEATAEHLPDDSGGLRRASEPSEAHCSGPQRPLQSRAEAESARTLTRLPWPPGPQSDGRALPCGCWSGTLCPLSPMAFCPGT